MPSSLSSEWSGSPAPLHSPWGFGVSIVRAMVQKPEQHEVDPGLQSWSHGLVDLGGLIHLWDMQVGGLPIVVKMILGKETPTALRYRSGFSCPGHKMIQ